MTLVVVLHVRRTMLEKFRAYENAAATIMREYGGAIERTVVVQAEESSPTVKEIHVVTFPDERAFRAYQEDPTLVGLRSVREEVVLQTEVMVGEDGPRYGALQRGEQPRQEAAPPRRQPPHEGWEGPPRLRPPTNEFGDPPDTVYAGGTPLFDERTGRTIPREAYRRRKRTP